MARAEEAVGFVEFGRERNGRHGEIAELDAGKEMVLESMKCRQAGYSLLEKRRRLDYGRLIYVFSQVFENRHFNITSRSLEAWNYLSDLQVSKSRPGLSYFGRVMVGFHSRR